MLFLNNASLDNTYSIIKKLINKYKWVKLITLSYNAGYQNSLLCGIKNMSADIYNIIDVDCEDPPEMILDFIKFYEKGFDLVYGKRVDRHENAILKFVRKIFYHIVKFVGDDDIILYMAEFSLFKKYKRSYY